MLDLCQETLKTHARGFQMTPQQLDQCMGCITSQRSHVRVRSPQQWRRQASDYHPEKIPTYESQATHEPTAHPPPKRSPTYVRNKSDRRGACCWVGGGKDYEARCLTVEDALWFNGLRGILNWSSKQHSYALMKAISVSMDPSRRRQGQLSIRTSIRAQTVEESDITALTNSSENIRPLARDEAPYNSCKKTNRQENLCRKGPATRCQPEADARRFPHTQSENINARN
jgi:hypothetical protein